MKKNSKSHTPILEDEKLTMGEFDLIKELGDGAYGKVYLVKKKEDTGDNIMALKILEKFHVIKVGRLVKCFRIKKLNMFTERKRFSCIVITLILLVSIQHSR